MLAVVLYLAAAMSRMWISSQVKCCW